MNGSSANDDPFAGLDLSPTVSPDLGGLAGFQKTENPTNTVASEASPEEEDFCDFEDAVDESAGDAIVSDAASESNNDDFEDAVAGEETAGTPEVTGFDAFAAISGEPTIKGPDGVSANGVCHEPSVLGSAFQHTAVTSPGGSAEAVDFFGDLTAAPQSATPAPLSTSVELEADGSNGFASAHQSVADDTPASSTALEVSEDDFGDFGSAISEPSESVSADAGSRAFPEHATSSEVASASASSGVATMEDTSRADAVALDVLTVSTVERPQQIDSTDGFGDFTAPSTVDGDHPPEANGGQQAAVIGGDDDDFGDFDAAPSVTDEVVGTVNSDFAPAAAAVGGDLLSKVAATEETKTPTFEEQMSLSTSPKDDFGAFLKEPAGKDENSGLAVGADDEFGGFGAATATIESPSTEDDDFGDFGAAPSSAEPDPHTIDPDPTIATNEDKDDDDFGDFGAAPPSVNGAASNDVPPVAADVEEDDFGDFDAAPVAVEEKPSSEGDDDFGDFDAAPVAVEEKPSNEDDDFGDFDAAPVAVEEKLSNEDDDDDFGDFDAAPVAAEEKPSNEDDAFGDFDAAPVAAEEKPSNEDDDDFGDFDAAPVAAEEKPSNENDDGFGEFGDFNDTAKATEMESQPSQAQAPTVDDPVVVRTKTFFPRLFAKYNPQTNDSQNEDEPSASASLHDILSSFEESSTGSRCSEYLALVKLLQEASLQDKLESRAVIRPEATGPFAHFTFPIGDLRLPDVHSQHIAKGLTGTNESYLPDVLPVQLPASPGRAPPSALDSSQGKLEGSTAVRKNPAVGSKVADSSPNGASSEQARHVLSQIPDLSYMLSSELQLPSAG